LTPRAESASREIEQTPLANALVDRARAEFSAFAITPFTDL
jgi:hypothetical protein